MKFTPFAALAVASIAGPLALAGQAEAQPLYAKLSLGQSTNTVVSGVNLNDGFAYGAAVGTGLGPFRVEAGVDRLAGSISFGPTIEAHALDYHANAYLDLPISTNVSVFGGGGVDYVEGEANIFSSNVHASGTGWNYALGAAARVGDRIVVEAQWRHVKADLSGDIDANMESDEATIGFRYRLT